MPGRHPDAMVDMLLDTVYGAEPGEAVQAPGPTSSVASNPPTDVIPVYAAKNHGAMGDGVTDDSAAIQSMHTLIPSVGVAVGGSMYLHFGTYRINNPITISKQNVSLFGPNWSFTEVGFSFNGSPNLPGAVIQPSSSATFPNNRWALEVNNTALQVTGFTLHDIAFDGGQVNNIGTVGAIRLSNCVGAKLTNFTIMNKFSGDGITVDQNGATYSPPSTSQLWFGDFTIYDCRKSGIQFGDDFMSEVFISDFMIGKCDINGIGTYVAQTQQDFDFHVRDGYVGTCTTGLNLTTSNMFIDNIFIENTWGHGIYIKQTSGGTNRKSFLRSIYIVNPDKNTNGTSAVLVDTGSKDFLLDSIICSHESFGEIGINIVDGLATFLANGNQLAPNCRSYGMTTANFKYGGTNYSSNYPPCLAPSTVTAGASPYTYTNNDGFPEILTLTTVNGISALTWKGIAGQPITAQTGYFYLAPGDTIIATWAGSAPVFTKYPVSTGY